MIPSLDSTFWLIASLSLDSAILIVVVATVCRMARNRMAPERLYLLWTLVWFSLFVPGFVPWPVSLPVAPPFTSGIAFTAEMELREAPASSPTPEVAEVASSLSREAVRPNATPLSLLPWIWLSGVCLLALRRAVVSVLWSRYVRRMPMIRDTRMISILETAARDLGIKNLPSVRRAAGLHTPAVTGYFHPVLLFPPEIESLANDETLRYIFLHELAHIKRGDHRLNAVLNILLILHWFNPLLYLAVRALRTCQEHACDAGVLRAVGPEQATHYGHALLDLFQVTRGQRAPMAFAPMFSGKSQLNRRITMLSNGSLTRRPTWKSAAVFLTLLAFSSINITFAEPESLAKTEAHTLSIETYPPDYPGGIFKEGDNIAIVEVTGTLPTLAEGGTYTVRGTYTLTSQETATLAFYATDGETEGHRNTVTVKRGKGEFTLSGRIAKLGDLHLSYYPAKGGEGFGGIYFRDAREHPAEPAPEIPIDFLEATPHWSADQVKSGNAITIRKVLGNRKAFEEGGSYIIEGDYTLATQEKAQLILFSTNGETESVAFEVPKGVFIEKGSGTFRLAARITKSGAPHVSMYPVEGGESFFNRYVVEKDALDIPGYLTLQK